MEPSLPPMHRRPLLALLAAAAIAYDDSAPTCVVRVWLRNVDGRATAHEIELDKQDAAAGVTAFLASPACAWMTASRQDALRAALYDHAKVSCFDRPIVDKQLALDDLASCHVSYAASPPRPLVFVAVGAHHWFPPVRDATLHGASEAHAWTGVLVEASPAVYAEMARRRLAHQRAGAYWPVAAAACAATSEANVTFFAAADGLAELVARAGNELREWASETGSLDRDQIVRALVGSEADPVAAEQYVQVSQ